MKTPYAILIGLALIAAALFFRQPSIAPAQAGLIGGVDGFECYLNHDNGNCAVLHGDKVTWVFNEVMAFPNQPLGFTVTKSWR